MQKVVGSNPISRFNQNPRKVPGRAGGAGGVKMSWDELASIWRSPAGGAPEPRI